MNLVYLLSCLLIFMSYGVDGFLNNLLDGLFHLFKSERCTPFFTADINIRDLMRTINDRVYGQPFVTEALMPLLISHRKFNKHHEKALVLSFHGSQGTGKNLVADIIVDHLFKKGRDSGYSLYFSGRTHFLKYSRTGDSELQLFEQITKQLMKCKYSVFVFDEVEKFPDRILDSLKYFVDYNSRLSGHSFENAIFIFLSNSGMESINKRTYELWQQNINRRDFTLKDFQHLIQDVYNSDGALKNSALISSALIDLFIPFLPLEKSHVIQCIRKDAEIFGSRISDKQIEEALSYADFEPEDTQVFSRNGCKNIRNKVKVVLSRGIRRHDEF